MNNIEAIMAVDRNFGLSKNGSIPWKNKVDIKFFKEKTINNIVVMGSKTLLSLPGRKPLKDRLNIILTNNRDRYVEEYSQYDNILFMSLEDFNDYCKRPRDETIFIIGGKEIFNLLLDICDKILITILNENYNCDLFLELDFNNFNISLLYNDVDINIYMLDKL